MKNKKLALWAGCLGLALNLSASGDLIVSYDFNSTDLLSATLADSGVIAGDITEGASFAGSADAGRSSSAGGNLFARASVTDGGGSPTLAGTIAAEDYFSFIVTPDIEMSLTSLDLNAGYSRSGGFAGKTLTANLLTSVDGFSAGNLVDSFGTSSDPASSTISYQNWSIDLSGPSFQNLSGPVEFRLYLFDDTSHADTIHRLDDFVLNGSVAAIPEASTPVLLGVGGVLLLAARRRRTRS